MTELPLFPLQAVVFPAGRIPLRIFEPRYRELVKTCIRDGSGFGIVGIRSGHEVWQGPGDAGPQVYATGTRVRIADWFALEHGLLGVVVEGTQRFRVLQQRQHTRDGLAVAAIAYLPDAAPVLADGEADALRALWADLWRHPQLQQLGYPQQPAGDGALLGSLLQVLPMDDSQRQQLLACFGEAACLQQLRQYLGEQGLA